MLVGAKIFRPFRLGQSQETGPEIDEQKSYAPNQFDVKLRQMADL